MTVARDIMTTDTRCVGENETLVDAGNYQDVTVSGDPQALLQRLVPAASVYQFEIRKPSLHDIFVRIARPTAAELAAEAKAS